jgi:ABC-2 type transport system permease protein
MWSVLNPLMMMAVISTVFSRIFRIETLHYPVYYLTGALVFNFMAEATSGSLASIVQSGGLIKKVYIPKYIFPLEKCLFALINALFSFTAVIVMMFILGPKPQITVFLFFIPLIYTLMFSAGLGCALASANVFFRDVGHLYGVWITAWMYLTPILYPVDLLPQGAMNIVKYNPMVYFADCFRLPVMYGKIPGLRLNLICAAYAVMSLAGGLTLLKKTQDRFVLYI